MITVIGVILDKDISCGLGDSQHDGHLSKQIVLFNRLSILIDLTSLNVKMTSCFDLAWRIAIYVFHWVFQKKKRRFIRIQGEDYM